jgi:replication initiation and membrane attachment protein
LHFRQERKREEERIRYSARASAETRESGGKSPDFKEEKPVEMAFYLEVPALFQGQCDIHQYNMLMRNEPYTLVLKRFFSKGRIPDGVLDIFEKIDLTYGLSEEVINVLIHFLHVDRRSWSKTSIEYVASDMLGKQVSSYEQAVQYVREQLEYKEKAAAKSTKKTAGRSARGQGTSKKPNIPIIEPAQEDAPPTEEEFEAMRRKALKLDGKIK